MTNSNINNFIDKTWVVAVSGGADSMALLNMAYELKLNISVAHVNYKKRITADRDMEGVMNYCKLRGIPCFVHIVTEHAEGNFQEFARDLRYNFFKEIVAKTRAHGVLVAHHLDDLIETYIIQKERKGIVKYYGIKEEAIIKKVLVKRVLLSYTKKELENYCKEKNITYYNDESNYSKTYTRNRIRIDYINNLSKKEKLSKLDEINLANKALSEFNTQAKFIYLAWDNKLSSLRKYDDNIISYVVMKWINKNLNVYRISKKNINEIVKLIIGNEKNWKHDINKIYQIYNNYDQLDFININNIGYNDIYDELEIIKKDYYEIRKEGNTIEGFNLYEEDYPISIRNAKTDDVIEMRYGKKTLKRFFIDKKISLKERKIWPVVVNSVGNVIFVPELGCDVKHYSNNMSWFMIK